MSLKEQINTLKKEKNAVILAHYYVSDEVQEIADYIGDSFLWSVLYGGKRQNLKSTEEGAYAGYECRLCDGSYGRLREYKEDKRRI